MLNSTNRKLKCTSWWNHSLRISD